MIKVKQCLWCGKHLIQELNWTRFIKGSSDRQICESCRSSFNYINKNYCRKCFKASDQKICLDCKSWHQLLGEDPLERNVSTFHYNSFMKEVIAKWKYRGDYMLIHMFQKDISRTVKKEYGDLLKDAVIIPIPLGKERKKDRKFNQALAIAKYASFQEWQIKQVVERIDSEKQAKKGRFERVFAKNPFKLRKNIKKTVILVDDIYTTGTTLRHVASLLKQGGCPAVYSYTLVRG